MDVVQALKERRSINFFDPERPVSDRQINELISLSNLTPSSYNLQPWEIVVVREPERKKTLRECAFGQTKVTEASAVFIIIANPNAVEENIDRVIEKQVELGYAKPEQVESIRKGPFNLYGGKESLTRKIFAVKNTSFFAMSIMAGARGMGLETHPMDGFKEDMIKKEFNIPDDRIIPLLIAVGYPKPGLKLLPRAFRREIEEFVYTDIYNKV